MTKAKEAALDQASETPRFTTKTKSRNTFFYSLTPTQHLPPKLVDRNKNKSIAQDEAVKIAKRLWDKDMKKEIRISMMSKMVFDELNDRKFEALPKFPEAIKRWIRHIVPDYAKKGGQPKRIY